MRQEYFNTPLELLASHVKIGRGWFNKNAIAAAHAIQAHTCNQKSTNTFQQTFWRCSSAARSSPFAPAYCASASAFAAARSASSEAANLSAASAAAAAAAAVEASCCVFKALSREDTCCQTKGEKSSHISNSDSKERSCCQRRDHGFRPKLLIPRVFYLLHLLFTKKQL